MDLKLKASPIQFRIPVLQQCEFTMNPDFIEQDKNDSSPLFLPIKTDVMYGDAVKENFPVSLLVQVGEKGANFPFFVAVRMGAVFSVEKNMPENMRKQFLSINAPAVLYSYIRPIIASLTSQSIFPQYDLPFMDFTTIGSNGKK